MKHSCTRHREDSSLHGIYRMVDERESHQHLMDVACYRLAADELFKTEILGIHITSGFSQSETILQQPGIEKLWEFTGGINNHFFGLATTAISHTDFINFKDNFEITGTIKIKEGFNQIGSYGFENSFDRFEDIFADLESHIESFRFERYPIKLVCDIDE